MFFVYGHYIIYALAKSFDIYTLNLFLALIIDFFAILTQIMIAIIHLLLILTSSSAVSQLQCKSSADATVFVKESLNALKLVP